MKHGTPTYDNVVDTFVFNGDELVSLGSGRYATRRESFARITHVTSGSDSWVVEHPDGRVQRFGTSSNSQVTNGIGQVFEWLISEDEDLQQNGMTFSWDVTTDPGQAYPLEIRYGLRRTAGGLTGNIVRKVQFVLEDRPDAPVSYLAGFPRHLTRRLARVDLFAHVNLVRRYVLEYGESFDSLRSLLLAVEEYGSDAESTTPPPTPPLRTTFAYSSNYDSNGNPLPGKTGWHDPNGWNWSNSLAFVTSTHEDIGTRLGDVNGDGLPDIVKYQGYQANSNSPFTLSGDSGVYFNDGSLFSSWADPAWAIEYSFPENVTSPFFAVTRFLASGPVLMGLGRLLLDLTGDGRVDMPTRYIGGPYHIAYPWFEGSLTGWIIRAGSFPYNFLPTIAKDVGSLDGTRWVIGGNMRFAELNGDGFPDLLVRGIDTWFNSDRSTCTFSRGFALSRINRGNFTFEISPEITETSSFVQAGGSPSPICSGDMHRTVSHYEPCAPSEETCQRTTFFTTTHNRAGSVFVNYTEQHLELGNLVADVNADGLDDLVSSYEDRNTPMGASPILRQTVYVNLGNKQFANTDDWKLPADALFTFVDRQYGSGGPDANSDLGTRLIDVNGDGRLDVLKARSGDSRKLWLNDGDIGQAGDDTPWREVSSGWSLPEDIVNSQGRDLGVRFADVDGDGMTDILRGFGGGNFVRLNNGVVPDLLETVTAPLGGTIAFEYTPSTQFSANSSGDPQYWRVTSSRR